MNATNALPLGNFSVSLAVKDLGVSLSFYQKLGFVVRMGDEKAWVILQNGGATIGLFAGMFEKNLLTFNPGWDAQAGALPEYTDVRDIQKQLRAKGIEPVKVADESTQGPESFIVVDPDGNQILVDQHV
jgi:lactoylglutathione lyase